MRLSVLMIASGLSLTGCDAPGPEDMSAYQKFLATQLKTRALAGGTLRGTVVVVPPAPLAGKPDDFCEVFVNGKKLGRFSAAKGDDPLVFENVALRSGPNRIALWDSSTERGASETLDSRGGLRVEIRIGEGGVEMSQTAE